MKIDKFLLNQRKLAELFTIEVQSNTDEDSVKRVYHNYKCYIRNLEIFDKPMNERLYGLVNKIYSEWETERSKK